MQPEIEQRGNSYHFSWPDANIKINVSRLRTGKDGRVGGEVVVYTNSTDPPRILHQPVQVNFTTLSAINDFTRTLSKKDQNLDWQSMLGYMVTYLVDVSRRGEPVQELWTYEDTSKPEYLLHPIMIKDYPTFLFGEPSTAKSLLSLVMATCLVLPWDDNPLGLEPPDKNINVLYLDFETDRPTLLWQLRCLKNGMHLPDIGIHYRRSFVPLVDDVEQIQNYITECKARAIIVDSVGYACSGSLNDDDTATGFARAIRQLNVTSLLLAHTSKDDQIKKKTIFGSRFWEAMARSIWEVRKEQESGEDEMSIALFHRKPPPFAKLHNPLGFHFSFNGENTTIAREDPSSVGAFLERMSATTRIREALADGALRASDLAELLGLKENTVRQSLNRLQKKGIANKTGDTWGLRL